jgi:succinate dehydrogenase / fumarate reductase cytochrome b subunit
MPPRLRVFSTSVGTKLLIALTGLFLVAYLVVHIAGNLMVFLGRDLFNEYSHTLTSNPIVVVIEVVLVIGFVIHIFKAVGMFLANRRARPVGYHVKRSPGAPSRKSLASSTMILTGVWLLVFVILHVQAFRFGLDYQTPEGIRDLYRVEMEIFSSPLTAAFYVLTMVLVGSHLWHGFSSAFQSLGADSPRWTPRLLMAGRALAVLIAGGFIVIAVWAYVAGGRS